MNILSQEIMGGYYTCNVEFLGIMILVLALVLAICILTAKILFDKESFGLAALVSILIVIGFGGAVSVASSSEYIEEYTQYKVTIDDTVKVIDFDAKYEIIDREGQIYTLIERTPAQ